MCHYDWGLVYVTHVRGKKTYHYIIWRCEQSSLPKFFHCISIHYYNIGPFKDFSYIVEKSAEYCSATTEPWTLRWESRTQKWELKSEHKMFTWKILNREKTMRAHRLRIITMKRREGVQSKSRRQRPWARFLR